MTSFFTRRLGSGLSIANRKLPFDAKGIHSMVLSHAHIDHCGRLPLLVARGFREPIYTNPACADLLPILLNDAADLALREAERAETGHPGGPGGPGPGASS